MSPSPPDAASDLLPRPMAGLRVLDCSRVLSGPFAGRILADLGADVVKLEPPEGDVTRIWGMQVDGRSGFFEQQNAGKRGICLDLKARGAAEVFVRLAAAADVVIENFRPGVLSRLGAGPDVLMAANPRLVVLSISGFGATGPDRDRPAYAPIVQAEAGLVERQSSLDGRTAVDPIMSYADTYAGLHGLIAVLAALSLRERTGTGQHIDLAMLDALVMTDDYAHHAVDESPLVRLGGHVWTTPDGPIVTAGELRFIWRVLSANEGLVDPTPFGASFDEKVAHRFAALTAWFATPRSSDSLRGALDRAGVAWGEPRTTRAAVRSPQAVARGLIADLGTRSVVQSPYRFSAAASGATRRAPILGGDAVEVMQTWLDETADHTNDLVAAGILLVPSERIASVTHPS